MNSPPALTSHSPAPTEEAAPIHSGNGAPPPALPSAAMKPAVVQHTGSAPPESGRGGWLGWVLLAVVAGGVWFAKPYWYPWIESRLPGAKTTGRPPAPRAVPVVTTTVGQRDVNLFLNGLGTVTAFNTVTVRSRVGGEVMNVAFAEGQTVEAGDLLVEIDPRLFVAARDQAAGTLAREEANLNLAQLTIKRTKDLLRSEASTQALLDQQQAAVQQSEAAVKVARAALDNAELQLTYCRITAPIGGRIGFRLVDQGNVVMPNDPAGLVVITQLEPITLEFTIPQDEIPRVQEQMRKEGSLAVDAFDRDFRRKLATGKLSAVDNQVDATTGTLRLKATFDNKDRALFPNQFVNARMLVDTLDDAVVVASSAVQRGPESTFVYVVKEDETVELRNVILGPAEGTDTAIREGLQVGDLVVTDGIDKLQPGAKVTPQEKKAKPPGGSTTPPENQVAAERN